MSSDSTVVVQTETRKCARHGDYLTRRWRNEHFTTCPKCSDEAIAKEAAAEAERDRQERIARAMRAAGIPAKFREATFDESTPAGLRRWTDAVLAGTSAGPAVLVGPVGTGKSHAASAALRHLIRAGARGLFVTPSDFGRAIRDHWQRRNTNESEATIVERYAAAPVLVLDDLGAHRAIDTERLQDLVCARYANDGMRSTIVTSNLAPAKFAGAIGDRAADRIREGSTIVAITGRSRRRPASEST